MAQFVSTAQCSDAGWKALELEEGLKTHAYYDTKHVLTIGYGHTNNAPSNIKFNALATWSKIYCDHVFRLDGEAFVQAANNDLQRVINQHQFDALVSLEYNIGMAGLRKSHLVDVINHHGPEAVTEADFLAWAHPSELKGRRLREWAMFSKGVYRAA